MDDNEEMVLVHSSDVVWVPEESLAHYGVAGMKWGKRTRSGGASNKQLRSLDKQSKANDRKARDGEIDAARDRYNNSARSNYKAAKSKYKEEKYVIGKREALKSFNKVKTQNIEDFNLSRLAKSGKEKRNAIILSAAGAVLVSTIRKNI